MVALFALMHVRNTQQDHDLRHFDLAGTFLVVLGLFGITYGAIGLGNGSGATGVDPLDVLALCVGIIAIALFIVVEMRSAHL